MVELRSLLARISSNYGGKLFYFVREKPIGSPGQVWGKNTDNNWENKREERTLECLSEAINRLCRYAEHEDQNILLFQDMINEKQRFHQVRRSYAHIYSRIKEHQEMLRILEAPAYIDSELSTNIQCADWVAALIGRACDYQLVLNSSYRWVADSFSLIFVEVSRMNPPSSFIDAASAISTTSGFSTGHAPTSIP